MKITIADLFDIPTAEIFEPDVYKSASSVSIDTRSINTGEIYVAIKGRKFDGHNFVNEAAKKGASAVIINRSKLKDFDKLKCTIVTVRNTTNAFADLAHIWRNKNRYKVISITGSNGKTTTKEFLYEILKFKFKVQKSTANNNNHIGVPMTLLSTKSGTDFTIVEHGTNHFGEIEFTAKAAEPDYAVITNIGESHVEFLKDLDGVFKEKSALLNHIAAGGKIFINSDDPVQKKGCTKFKNKITFGFKGKPNVKGRIREVLTDGTSLMSIETGRRKFDIRIPIPGRAAAQNFLTAATVALHCGSRILDIKKAAKNIEPVSGRMKPNKLKNSLIIDDTYNASPGSFRNAVYTLADLKKYKSRILIAGDIFELGKRAKELHLGLAEDLKRSKITEFISLGKNMKFLSEALEDSKIKRRHFVRRNSLKKYLKELTIEGSAIVVKGSRGMHMEEFVEILTKKD